MNLYRDKIKRIIDIFSSIIGLPFLILVYIPVYFLIKIEDKGPVIYKSLRLGKGGMPYNMFKFRSMIVNAPDLRLPDGSTYNSKDDIRVTKTGKFLRESSLDEIPQILNVLLGQMSLIGPRPDLYSGKKLSSEQELILQVKPGMTGYNQAYYRNETDKYGKWRNDIYYVQNLSFILDMKILFKTIGMVLKKEKMYRN